jgi:riboflavin synthase
MFTGIVEAIGEVVEVKPGSAGFRLLLQSALAGEMSPGDSLAVNGVCLTVLATDGGVVQADVGPETARITNLKTLAAGAGVNLERPMRLDGRLGGHLVQGHVDGLGTVQALREDAGSHWLTVSHPPDLAPLFIRKGSVAVDGVSLTVASLADSRFDVQIVPYTWTHTTFHRLRIGDLVNVECDMIGKYVVRALDVSRWMTNE